jgi:hypothetical protein
VFRDSRRADAIEHVGLRGGVVMVFGVVDQRRRVVEDSVDEIRRRQHFDALCCEGFRKQQRFTLSQR